MTEGIKKDTEVRATRSELQNGQLIMLQIIRLRDLQPLRDATYAKVNKEPCVEGTRKEIIERVIAWCKDTSPGSPAIYWLSGMAGTGKSTIAYTICQQLCGDKSGNDDAAQRLGASFFCSRQVEAARARMNIVPTIVHDLAHSFPAFGRAILSAKLDAKPPQMERHIPNMLFDRWSEAVRTNSSLPPLVVVVDALDELDADEGSAFLEQLIEEVTKRQDMLQGLKFFVTSRQDPRIVQVCNNLKSDAVCRLEEVSTDIVEHDINLYLCTKLPALDGAQLHTLVGQASGLFIYAATAVRFIIPSPRKPPTAVVQKQRLDILTKTWPGESQRTKDGLLVDHLYEDILASWLSPMSEDDQVVAISILQTIVCAEEPVLVSDISHLLGEHERPLELVQDYIQSLHSVLYLSNDRAYLYHKSFVDFMFDSTRFTDMKLAGRICPTAECQFQLALSCFQVMELLRFNICELPSSYLNDSEVPGLADCVSQNISSVLRYTCRHWATHMSKTKTKDRNMRGELKEVFQRWLEEKSLFWMEAMNLLHVMSECYWLLREAHKWFEEVSSKIQ